MLWQTESDPHFLARITAGIAVYDGKVFVPVSSSEEFSSGNAWYPCCTARGSVVELDASTGEQVWKAWVVEGDPQPWVTQDNGVVLYRPGGGAVWNSPTVDPVRNAVYFGTGDATTPPSPPTTDGVMAVDIDTGRLLWSYQATENDVFMGGCGQENRSLACPEQNGPDADIGNSPILTTLPNGQRALLTGTKGGDLFALDPDNNGPCSIGWVPRAVNPSDRSAAGAGAAPARSYGVGPSTNSERITDLAAGDSPPSTRPPERTNGSLPRRLQPAADAERRWARRRPRFPESFSRAHPMEGDVPLTVEI